jgi:hypothetical protein
VLAVVQANDCIRLHIFAAACCLRFVINKDVDEEGASAAKWEFALAFEGRQHHRQI